MGKNSFLKAEELFERLPSVSFRVSKTQHAHVCGTFSRFWGNFSKDKCAVFGLVTITVMVVGAVFVPSLSSYNYYRNHLSLVNNPPSWKFLFGTDELGRDIFVRVWYGARVSLCVGFGTALADFVLGSLVGGYAGYRGGRADEAIMRFVDIFDSVPTMIKAMAFMTLVKGSFLSVLFVISATSWLNTARIVRGQVAMMKRTDFVVSARSVGASDVRILTKHIFPNIFAPLMVSVAMSIPFAIFSESFLSFLGLGIELPIPSWGSMVSDGLVAMRYYPWRIFFPSFFVFLTILSFNFVSAGLKNAADSKSTY